MKKTLIKFFDKLEDKVRIRLSHRAIFYALIGGIATVLFWRGIWHTADILEKSKDYDGILGILFSGPVSLIISTVILLLTGLFVSVFIGDKIIISGLKQEKKVFDKTESEVKEESDILLQIKSSLEQLRQEVSDIRRRDVN